MNVFLDIILIEICTVIIFVYWDRFIFALNDIIRMIKKHLKRGRYK